MTEQVTAPEWISSLTDDGLKADPSIQSFKSVDDLAKSYISTKSLVGKKGVILPGEGAKDEEWNSVYDAIGRPKSPDEYKIPEVKLKDGMQLNEAELKEFRQYAHSIGVPQKQFEKILAYRFDKQMKEYESSQATSLKAKQDGETKLRTEFGAKYDETLANVQKTLKMFGKDLDLPDDPNAYDAKLVSLFARMSANFSEATIGELGMVKGGVRTPDEAKAEIAKIRGDEKHPFNDNRHPEHKQAILDMEKLYAMANPGKKNI